jgi:hypothetical protein
VPPAADQAADGCPAPGMTLIPCPVRLAKEVRAYVESLSRRKATKVKE